MVRRTPLFIELENFREVNTCRDNNHIDWIKKNYKCITPEFFILANLYFLTLELCNKKDDLNGIENSLNRFFGMLGLQRMLDQCC